MAVRPAGISSITSADNAGAFTRIELTPPSGRTIEVTEIGISHDAAPNSVDVPIVYNMERMSTAGTGGTATAPVELQSDLAQALDTTAAQNRTVNGTLVETLHRFAVPIVSGVIWVAAPGREFDIVGTSTNTGGIRNLTALPTSDGATVYMVFEE